MLPWWAWSLTANVGIQCIEYLNRTSPSPDFGRTLIRSAPLILLSQWGLFHAWRGAPSWLLAWAFFTVCNNALRIMFSWQLGGEPPTWTSLLGCLVIGLGASIMAYGSAK